MGRAAQPPAHVQRERLQGSPGGGVLRAPALRHSVRVSTMDASPDKWTISTPSVLGEDICLQVAATPKASVIGVHGIPSSHVPVSVPSSMRGGDRQTATRDVLFHTCARLPRQHSGLHLEMEKCFSGQHTSSLTNHPFVDSLAVQSMKPSASGDVSPGIDATPMQERQQYPDESLRTALRINTAGSRAGLGALSSQAGQPISTRELTKDKRSSALLSW